MCCGSTVVRWPIAKSMRCDVMLMRSDYTTRNAQMPKMMLPVSHPPSFPCFFQATYATVSVPSSCASFPLVDPAQL